MSANVLVTRAVSLTECRARLQLAPCLPLPAGQQRRAGDSDSGGSGIHTAAVDTAAGPHGSTGASGSRGSSYTRRGTHVAPGSAPHTGASGATRHLAHGADRPREHTAAQPQHGGSTTQHGAPGATAGEGSATTACLPAALVIADADGDGDADIVVGTVAGTLLVFKVRRWPLLVVFVVLQPPPASHPHP